MKIEVSEEIRGVCPQFAGVAIMANVRIRHIVQNYGRRLMSLLCIIVKIIR